MERKLFEYALKRSRELSERDKHIGNSKKNAINEGRDVKASTNDPAWKKQAIEEYKQQHTYNVTDENGNVVGRISQNAKDAIEQGRLFKYSPRNIEEQKAFSYLRKKQNDEERRLERTTNNYRNITSNRTFNGIPNLNDKKQMNDAYKQVTNSEIVNLNDKKQVKNAYNQLTQSSTNNKNKNQSVNNADKKTDNGDKASFGSWMGSQIMSGVAQFNKGVFSTLDFVLPTEFLGRYDYVSNLNDYYGKLNDDYGKKAQQASESRGKGWKLAGDVLSSTIAAVPDAVLAYMTAGTSLGASAAGKALPVVSNGSVTAAAFRKTVNSMMKNPMYWTSVLRTLGTDYEEAKERGANDLVAASTAIITTALNAGIEVGGGIEKLPEKLKSDGKNVKDIVYEWAKSALEEGNEEVLQGITTNAVAKIMYDHKAPIVSLSDDNAVINPLKSAKEFGMGAAVGGLLGGAQTAATSAANTADVIKTGKLFSDPSAIQTIINTGLDSPTDSKAYKLAAQAQNKKSKPSNYEVGRMFYANAEQINKEMLADSEAADAKSTPVLPASDTAVERSVAATEAVTPNSSSTVSTDVPSTDTKTDTSGELSEIMNSEPIKTFTPKTASDDIKRLENILIAKGADDKSRQGIIGTALEVEKALGGTDKAIRSVFDKVSKITSNAIGEIQNTAGLSDAYWKLFGENFKSLSYDNAGATANLVTEYANAYAEAMKKSNPERYNSVMVGLDGKDLSSELPRTIMQNVIPQNVRNTDEYRNIASQIKNIVNNAGIQLKNERTEIYNVAGKTTLPVAEKTTVYVGEKFKDTKTGNTITVVSRDAENTTVEIDTGIKTETRRYINSRADTLATNEQFEQMESSEVVSPEDAQRYNIVVSNLKRKAEELGLLDNNFFTALQNVNLYNPSASDRALISTEFRRVFAGNTDPLVTDWLNAISVEAQPVTSINEQNMPVSSENTPVNEDVTDIDVYLKDGEILSLKHTKNVYSLFKGAMRIVVGKDIITDGFVVLPLTDESLAGVKKVIGDSAPIQENPNFDMKKFYHADNDVIIQGNPKVGEATAGNKTVKAYTFKIADAFYSCQQKFIDVFNNGKNVIKANKSINIPWTVHNENGELVALFLGLRANVTEENYNQMLTVAGIKSAEQQKKAKQSFNPSEVKTIVKGSGIPRVFEMDGSKYVTEGHFALRTDDAGIAQLNGTVIPYHSMPDGMQTIPSDAVKKLLDSSYAVDVGEFTPYTPESEKDAKTPPYYAFVADGIAHQYSKKFVDALKKRSTSMKLTSGGTLNSTLIVGYDADGNVTGFVLPVYANGNSYIDKDGNKIPFATNDNLKNLVKDSKDVSATAAPSVTEDVESGIKSDKTVTETPESVTEPTESVIKKADSVTETPDTESAVPYTDREKQNWESSNTIIVYESDEQFEAFVEKVLNNEDTHKKIYFGKIPDATAQMVLDKTGVDVSGHNIALKGYEIRKILLNSHGDEEAEATRGQEPITTDDLKNIPSVITNPDDVNLSDKEYEGKPALLFEKTIDGKNYVVAYVSRKHHDIAIQTMYKKRSLATAENADALSSTPETTSSTASNNIVSQDNDIVNSSVRTDTKNDASKVYDVAYFEKLGSDIRKGESVSLKDVRTAVDALLLNHGEAIKAELSQLKNDELKKRISVYDRGRITKKAEMVDSIYTDMLSSLYYALSGKETITYIYDGTGFEAQQSKMLFDISRELTEETFNKRLAENAEKYKKQVAAREEKLAKVKNPQTLEDYAYKKRYFGLSDEETIQYENLYAEERRKAREEKKAAKTTKDTSGADAFFANTDNYTIEKTTHTKTGEDVWVVRPASRLETEQWKQLNEQMKALGGSYWRGNQGWNFKKDPTAAIASTKETETVKGSTNAEKLRAVAEGMQKAIDDKFRDRLTNTAKRAREAASAEAEGERLKRLQDTINNIADALEDGENTLLDKIDSKAQVETLMSMLRTGRRNRISETLPDITYDERLQEQDKPYSNDDAKYAEYPLTKLHENIISGYLRAAEGKTGYKQIADRLKKALKTVKNRYVTVDAQIFSDIDKIVQNLSPFYEELWNNGVSDRKRLARMGIENVVELRAYLREFINYLPEKDVEAEKQRAIKEKERQLANAKIEGFFPTPKAIVEKMLDEADIKPDEKVLEPSAGKGNIADAIRESYPDNALDVVEWNASLNELLSEKGHNVVGVDFLKTSGKYDKIIMNPPFEKGQDIDHIRHAYSLLNNGGRVVCIMSEGTFYRNDKKATEFREWLDSLGGVSEKLPDGAFKNAERSTGVNTRVVVIDKVASETKPTKSKSDTVHSSKGAVKKEKARTLPTGTRNTTHISVKTDELPVKFTNVNEARKAFVNYAHDNFPKNVINFNTEAEIGISRTGIDKFLSGNISIQKYATGFKIPELIESAVKVGEAENQKGKSGINGYDYYDNLLSINGKDFAVHIRVRKTDMGDKYYGHTISRDVDDIKIEPLAWNSDKQSVHSINALGSATDIVSQSDSSVNNNYTEKSENYSRPSQSDKNIHSSKDIVDNDSISRWTTERVEGSKDSKVNIADIVKGIRDKFGIPVATGKVTDREATGIYKDKPETIRTRIANNLPTISHELGHHLDKKYDLSKLESVKELRKVISEEFLKQYPANAKNSEAVAEFVRIYLKNTNDANRLCPDFYSDFISTLSKEDLKSLNEIASSVNEYLSYNISERYDAAIVSSQKKEKVPFREKWHELYSNWVDAFHPQKKAVDYVEDVTGKTLSGKNNAYVLATNSLNAHTVANFVICDGFRDLDGNVINAKSFIDSIGMVDAKNIKLLDRYLVLKHSLEWIAPEQEDVTAKRVFADDTLENVEAIKNQIAEIEKAHPEIKTAAENLYEYQNNVLKHFVIPAGGMTTDMLETLNRKYPNYVPFYRAVGKKSVFAKGTFANQHSPIMRAKGSGALIISPVESIIKNTEKMIKFAMRNQVMSMWADYAETVDGFGQYMEKVAPDMMPHFTSITQQKEKFEDALQNVVSSNEDYFAVSDLFDEIFGDAVADFTPVANENKKIVTVLKDGTPSYYQIHDNAFYNSVAELSPQQTSGLLRIMNSVMQPMKLLITQNNPIFAVTNALRDFGTAYKLSQVNNPITFAAQYIKALGGIVANSESYKQYKAMGGGHSSELSANIDNISKTLRSVAQKDMGKARRLAYSMFRHPVETVASLNDAVESVPRFAEFQRTLSAGGDLQEAIFNASDITTNFKRSGKGATAKAVNKLILFNNAAIQGLDKTARTLTAIDHRKRLAHLLKFVLVAMIGGLIRHFWNKEVDEEGYKNLSSYKKNNFYNFAIGDGKFISLPKERENSVLDSLVERTLEYATGNDKAFYDFGGYLSSQLLPPMLPDTANPVDAVHSILGSTIFGGLVDVGFNQDFKGTPIEGAYDKYTPSNERYTESTTKIAYALGQTKLARDMDMSPKKIDHLISSYTGILGQVNKALFTMNESRRDASIGLRNKFISDSNYSTDVLNRMYENEEKAEKAFNYSRTIDTAIEYEKNAVITSYISGMNKAIKALPEEKQRNGRAYLLKTLNSWNYDDSTSQLSMLSSLEGSTVSENVIFTELPSSTLEWTENKQKYVYQMTPQEYYKYVNDYMSAIEDARKQYGYGSIESCEKAKEAAKDYMSKYKKNVLKKQYLNKAVPKTE